MKQTLVDQVLARLTDEGYLVSDCRGARSCFDVIARQGNNILLVKVVSNVEGFTRDNASELQQVASLLEAKSIVVSERMKSDILHDDILYDRHGVYVMNLNSFANFVGGVMPSSQAVRGGYISHIDSSLLVEWRRKNRVTQDELARLLCVSKQSVYRYESSGQVPSDVLEKISALIGLDVTVHRELENVSLSGLQFNRQLSRMKTKVLEEFVSIGVEASATNAPFDVFARDIESIFAMVSNDWRRMQQRAEILDRTVKLLGGHCFCVSRRRMRLGMPVVSPKELQKLKGPRELIDLIS